MPGLTDLPAIVGPAPYGQYHLRAPTSTAPPLQSRLETASTAGERYYNQLLGPNAKAAVFAQDGVELGDVVLPPWAGGSPEECVRLHRQALEGEVLTFLALLELHGWQDSWPGMLASFTAEHCSKSVKQEIRLWTADLHLSGPPVAAATIIDMHSISV